MQKRRYPKRAVLCLSLCLLLCLSLGTWLCACSSAGQKTVASCNGDPVLQEEYDYLNESLRTQADTEETLRQKIERAMIEDRAVLAAGRALLNGLTIEDAAVQDAVDAGVKQAIESYGGKSEYKTALKALGLTEHHFRRMLAISEIQRLVQEAIFAGTAMESENSFSAWLKDSAHYARAEQFVFSSAAAAEQFRQAVAGGANAESACTQAGGTVRRASYFFLGLGGDAVDTAIFSLPTDGATLSPAVEQDGSFTVYRRLAVSETEREDMAALQGLAVRDRLRELHWTEILEGYAKDLTVEWSAG